MFFTQVCIRSLLLFNAHIPYVCGACYKADKETGRGRPVWSGGKETGRGRPVWSMVTRAAVVAVVLLAAVLAKRSPASVLALGVPDSHIQRSSQTTWIESIRS